jgi:hypothetical protein
MGERWVTQTAFYDPAIPTSGNCVQAAVASLLALPLEDVPNFIERGFDWSIWLEDWLAERRLMLVRFDCEMVWDGLYLASGPSPRGVNHMVVMQDGKLVHDPHPSRAGLEKITATFLLAPYDPATPTPSDPRLRGDTAPGEVPDV